VDAVCAGEARDVGAVVYDAQDAGVFADLCEFVSDGEKGVIVEVFCAELYAVGAAGDAAICEREYVGGQTAGDEDVEFDAFEFFDGVVDGEDVFLEGVGGVAHFFEFASMVSVEGLGGFGENAEGFGETAACGGEAVVEAGAFELVLDGLVGADVAECVSVCDEAGGVYGFDCGCEGVAQFFGAASKRTGLECEATNLFYGANGFTGAVEIGIDDSVKRPLHNFNYKVSDWRFVAKSANYVRIGLSDCS